MNANRGITLDAAFRIVDETLAGTRVPAERIAVRDAIGRVLLEDQVSRWDLPPFDKSAMDGYAVSAGDVRDEYRVLETVAAGQVGAARLSAGCCVKVMTGAAVPPDTGRVIMVEHTEACGATVKVHTHDNRSHVCPRGEDVRRGQTVLPAGTELGVVDVTNLLACGIVEVSVARRVRVAILATGDELVEDPADLEPGKIINTNGPMLSALARQFGMEVVKEAVMPDERRATTEGIRSALTQADIVVLSGGVSMGDLDCVLDAMTDAGLEVCFSRIAVKPGAPMTFARGPDKAVFGLPGNPVTAYLMFHLFVLRAAARLSGTGLLLREFACRLGCDFERRKTDRDEYVPCRLRADGHLEPVAFHGSAHLAALLETDGFFIVPAGKARIEVGEPVAFLPTAGRMGERFKRSKSEALGRPSIGQSRSTGVSEGPCMTTPARKPSEGTP